MTYPKPEVIKNLREQTGYTVLGAAEKVKVSARTWTRWEQGKARMNPCLLAFFLLEVGHHPTLRIVRK